MLAKKSPSFGVAQDHPLQANIFEMLGTELACVCAVAVVRAVLSSNSIVKSISRVQGQNARDVQRDRRNDDILVR